MIELSISAIKFGDFYRTKKRIFLQKMDQNNFDISELIESNERFSKVLSSIILPYTEQLKRVICKN